ncbi:MAG: hypothetical protein LBC18_11710, partial [Opitutaceae bacterium]|nr:hypothetical protein [Opitutaceae bacterium]
ARRPKASRAAAANAAAKRRRAGWHGRPRPCGGGAAGLFGVRRVPAAFDGGIYPAAPAAATPPNAATRPNAATPSGGAINRPVKSGDKSPHSIKTPSAPPSSTSTRT